MTKEQAIELCKQIWGTSSLHNSFKVLRPGIGTIDACPLSSSYQTKQEKEWAALFREASCALDPEPPVFVTGMSEALDPATKRCADNPIPLTELVGGPPWIRQGEEAGWRGGVQI